MTWWQILLLCWFFYFMGLLTAGLCMTARGDTND